MKRLAILRHAKSSWDDESLDDFSRPLNERGAAAAFRIGQEMRKRDMHFDHVAASEATRVRQTLKQLSEGYGETIPARFDDRIYMAGARTLLEVIRELPDAAASALLVGHNPGLQLLSVTLSTPAGNGLRERVEAKFPTAALAILDLDIGSWVDAEPGCGTITDLILPRELA